MKDSIVFEDNPRDQDIILGPHGQFLSDGDCPRGKWTDVGLGKEEKIIGKR